MSSKNLVILSVSAGAGHLRAAEALRCHAEKMFPAVRAIHLDVMDFVPRLFKKLYAETYLSVVKKHPALWGYLYDQTDQKQDRRLENIRIHIEKLSTTSLRRELQRLDPFHVICTHFLPAELLYWEIERVRFDRPVSVVVTDFDVHRVWVQKNMGAYFVASGEVAVRLASRGIQAEKIHVTGIPIMPAFAEKLPRDACAAAIGLDPSKKTLLLMSGGFGVGKIDEMARRLLSLGGDFQIIALAGRNRELLETLKGIAAQYPRQVVAMGFTNRVERLMAASDLAVTKPGGLTSSECLAMGLPMVVIDPIPGQEERNADYLLESGAALKAYDPAGLAYKISRLLKDPLRLEAMRQNALRIGTPQAAREILRRVIPDR